jgi:hypothetical protein
VYPFGRSCPAAAAAECCAGPGLGQCHCASAHAVCSVHARSWRPQLVTEHVRAAADGVGVACRVCLVP